MKFIKSFLLYFLCVLCVNLFSCARTVITVNNNDDEIIIDAPQDPLREKAKEIAASMDGRLLAAQVIITGIDGRGSLPSYMKLLLEDAPAGGVMLFGYNLDADKDSIRNLISESASLITEKSGIAPFIACDIEGGIVARINNPVDFPAITSLPAASSYWMRYPDLEWNGEGEMPRAFKELLIEIERDSYNAASEAAAVGINLNFAPVAESLNYDNMTFLLYRSYGHDIFFTAEASAAFINGMKRAGVMCVPKHFPGSAGRDPHYTSSVVNFEIESSWKEDSKIAEYVFPFSNLISRGARAIMAAHTLIPQIDSKIASLSSVIMQDWLRCELGFDGIIIADDFTMAAAGNARHDESAVLSVAAGTDMVIVWQNNLKITHEAFIAALEDGRLSRARLEEAAARVIYEKLRMGLVNYF